MIAPSLRRLVPVFAVVTALSLVALVDLGHGGTSKQGARAANNELTFARAFDALTFNPIKTNGDNGSLWDMVQIYDQLVEYQPGKFDPQPAIARSWKAAKNGLTYTFQLRPMKFSDGSPLTSADVKFSIDRFANPKTNPGFAFLAESIKSTTAPSKTTFVLHLRHPDASILAALAVPVASIYSQRAFKRNGGDKGLTTKPVGSGPFALKSWVRGKVVELVRNQYYWRAGLPKLDAVHVTYVPNDTTRLLQVQSGQADVAEAVPFAQLAQLDMQPNVHVQIEPIVSYDAIFLNHKYPPLADRNVRQALAYSLDLDGINRAVYAGKAESANSTIAKMKYWTSAVKPYTHDAAKAKQLLASSKFPKGFSLDFLVPAGDTVHRSVALIAKDAWAPLGVKVNVVTEEGGALFTDFSKGKYQATIPMPVITSDILVPDELGLSWLQWTPGYQGFFTNYKNPALGRMVATANQTLNEAKRGAMWRKIQAISMRDCPWIPLFFVPARTAVRDDVHGFKTLQSAWWTLAETSKG